MTIEQIIGGIMCETCSEERTFGNPPNDSPDNKYIYLDFGGNTRCFCKKHMSYTNEGKTALLHYEDDWKYVCYGAKLISEIINNSRN